jgi:hypothetical protein
MRFGYEVSFTGVGTAENALRDSSELLDQFPAFLTAGYCTQIAIFTRIIPRIISSSTPQWGTLEIVTRLIYPCNIFTEYPPNPDTIATSLGSMWRQFRPEINIDSKFTPSPTAKIFQGVHFECDDVLICQLAVDKLWDLNYSVGKLCRFNKNVFTDQVEKIEGKSFDRGISHFWCICNLIEFAGIEMCGGSLRSFRFSKIDGNMHILYEFSMDSPDSFDLYIFHDDLFDISD